MFKWFKPKPRPTQVLTLPEPKAPDWEPREPVEDPTPAIDLNHADPILGRYKLKSEDPFKDEVFIDVVEEKNGYVKYYNILSGGRRAEDHWSMQTDTLQSSLWEKLS